MRSNAQGLGFKQNLEHLAKQFTSWNINHFGFIHEKLKNLGSQLKFIQFCSQSNEQIHLEKLLHE